MRKPKLEVGQRVGTFFDKNSCFSAKPRYDSTYGEDPVFGKITEVLTGGKVRVQFDREYLNEAVHDTKTGKLISRQPALVEAKLFLPEEEVKAKFSILEKEYDLVAKQVRDKLKIAAQAIREAQKLAKKELGTNLSEMYVAYDPLYNAMDAAGWRTSSFGC